MGVSITENSGKVHGALKVSIPRNATEEEAAEILASAYVEYADALGEVTDPFTYILEGIRQCQNQTNPAN